MTKSDSSERKCNQLAAFESKSSSDSNELLTNDSHFGYRIMYQCLCSNNIFVDREAVRVTSGQ